MKTLQISLRDTIAGALILSLLLYGVFLMFEPAVGLTQTQDQFEISLTVTEELTFQTPANNVILLPNLSGLTGGTANGQTQVVVRTNNATGYNMTLTSSSSDGRMEGETQGGNIPTMSASGTIFAQEPGFTFDTTMYGLLSSTSDIAAFGYTVEASTTGEIDPSFRDDASNDCNTGSDETADQCWIGATSSAFTIINRSSATPASGATTTLKFRAIIMPNPSPAIAEDTYTATTTLTATANP